MTRSRMVTPSFANYYRIDEIRRKFDPLYGKAKPHIALVFPFSCFASLVCCLILTLAALRSARADETSITVGLLAALSGNHAIIGQDIRRGFETARRYFAPEDRVGSHKLKFVYGDSQGWSNAAVSEFHRLAEIENAQVVATHLSQIVMSLNPLSLKGRISLLGIAGQERFTADNAYALRFWPSTLMEAEKLCALLEHLESSRLALVTVQNEYPLSLREQLRAKCGGGKPAMVFDEIVDPSQQEFASLVPRVLRSQPDTVMVSLVEGQSGAFINKLRELGGLQRLIGNFWISKEKALGVVKGAALSNIYFVQPDVEKPKFRELLNEAFPGEAVSAATYAAFSAIAALTQTLKSNPDISNRESLARELSGLEMLSLPDERLPVHGREVQYNLVYHRYEAGEIEPFQLP